MTAVKLTSLSHGAGLRVQGARGAARPARPGPPAADRPDLLVGTATSDDAAVYRLREDLALVQTVDFFTPIVDDPYDFGRIAATNALSDVYAMGGPAAHRVEPRRVVGSGSRSRDARRGPARGPDVVSAAGASIVGGHTIDDPEPKYGLAVTGVVDPADVLTNAGGRRGDALVLTKPLGAGAVTTALKKGLADDEVLARGRRGDDRAERGRGSGGAGGRSARDDRRNRLRAARPSARTRTGEWRGRGGRRGGGAGDRGRRRAAGRRPRASPAAAATTAPTRRSSRRSPAASRRCAGGS